MSLPDPFQFILASHYPFVTYHFTIMLEGKKNIQCATSLVNTPKKAHSFCVTISLLDNGRNTHTRSQTHTHTCPVYHTIPIIIPLPICQAQIEAVHLLLFTFIYLFSFSWNCWQCILLEQFKFYSELFYWQNDYQSATFNSTTMQRCNGHMCRNGTITPLSKQLLSFPAKIIPNWTYYLDLLKLFVLLSPNVTCNYIFSYYCSIDAR